MIPAPGGPGLFIMGNINVEYAIRQERLQALLESVDRPGGFCVHGRAHVPMPAVEVEGAGMLSFPVPASQIRDLVKMAERAPYGKGEETLVDTSVRDCRQIDQHRLDMFHVTERRGRPFTLVCTKNRASHERRLKEYAKDLEWMRSLAERPPGGEKTAAVAQMRSLWETLAAADGISG